MTNGKTALALSHATPLAKNEAARWGKYEVLVGERKQYKDFDIRYVAFPKRGKDGISILIADSRFSVHRDFAEFNIDAGNAFVTTEDITAISDAGLALKISLDKDSVRLPLIPLHHVVGMDGHGSKDGQPKTADFSDFGIPLKIVSYNFPDSPYEAFARTFAEHFGKPSGSVNREETLSLSASANPRVLFAYGQSLYLNAHDLSSGLMAAIAPETEVVLQISRRPRLEGETFYPSYGAIIVLEDLESAKLSS